jgi:hypothetical protein
MTLEEIENVDKELLAARYDAAVMKEFRELATSWFKIPLDELISKSRADGRVFAQGSKFFLKTDEIVTEYDYEMERLSELGREGGKALISSYANFLTENSSQIADLNLEETFAAMIKHRYGQQQLVSDFTLCLHSARLADSARGCPFIEVIRFLRRRQMTFLSQLVDFL